MAVNRVSADPLFWFKGPTPKRNHGVRRGRVWSEAFRPHNSSPPRSENVVQYFNTKVRNKPHLLLQKTLEPDTEVQNLPVSEEPSHLQWTLSGCSTSTCQKGNSETGWIFPATLGLNIFCGRHLPSGLASPSKHPKDWDVQIFLKISLAWCKLSTRVCLRSSVTCQHPGELGWLVGVDFPIHHSEVMPRSQLLWMIVLLWMVQFVWRTNVASYYFVGRAWFPLVLVREHHFRQNNFWRNRSLHSSRLPENPAFSKWIWLSSWKHTQPLSWWQYLPHSILLQLWT